MRRYGFLSVLAVLGSMSLFGVSNAQESEGTNGREALYRTKQEVMRRFDKNQDGKLDPAEMNHAKVAIQQASEKQNGRPDASAGIREAFKKDEFQKRTESKSGKPSSPGDKNPAERPRNGQETVEGKKTDGGKRPTDAGKPNKPRSEMGGQDGMKKPHHRPEHGNVERTGSPRTGGSQPPKSPSRGGDGAGKPARSGGGATSAPSGGGRPDSPSRPASGGRR